MSKTPRRKPTIVHVSPEETLIVFPLRPGVLPGRACNPSFEEYKHLLSDRPLRRPYGGRPSGRRCGVASTKRGGRRRHKPKP
jgi:hypothetical protein